jgi:hypothetical protein
VNWFALVLFAIGGLLVGGVVSLWNTARVGAVICGVLAVMSIAGGVLWLVG